MPDTDNPLQWVNEMPARLKNFLYAHNGFDWDSMHGYINLFSFAMNPPSDHLEKVKLLLNLAILMQKPLRYREFYKV